MRNLKKSELSIDKAFEAVAKGLNMPKREFWIGNEACIKKAFLDYEDKANNNKLVELKPLWTDADEKTYTITKKGISEKVSKKHRSLAYEIYQSSRPFVLNLWDELKLLNSKIPGKKEEILCPICELRPCNQMDHHAPRAINKFPEYSACYSNLIPLCDDCNEPKSDNWTEIIDGEEKRIWFNPYFDKLPSFTIFEANIFIELGLPLVTVKLSSSLDKNNELHDVIYRTVEHLCLLKRYEEQLKIRFNSFNEIKLLEYKQNATRYKDAYDYVESLYDIIIDLLRQGKRQTIIEILMYKAIISSTDYKTWLIDQLCRI